MEKINIAHIITKLELGGAQENTLYTVKNLPKDRYNVFLIAGKEGYLVDEANAIQDIKVILLSTLRREINPVLDIVTLIKLRNILKKENIQIVHTHSSKAGIIGRTAGFFAKVPIIIHTIHGFSFNDHQNYFIRNLYILLERICASFTDMLITVSSSDIKKGLKAGIGNLSKYILIRSGINIDKSISTHVNIEEKKKELNLPINKPIVTMIACFKPQKAPLDFIKTASDIAFKLPDTQFLLVGDGELRKDIEKLIISLNLSSNIKLLGWRKDITEILEITDVFVLTSLWEGLPRTILEAMASAKPVVATNVDGSKEVIIDGKTGYLTNPHDIKMIAEKVIFLLQNQDIAEQMGKNGRNSLNDSFKISKMVGHIEKLYETLIANSNTKNRKV